jgi:zinc transport system permease protein
LAAILSYSFMQRALLVGLLISAVCAMLGVFLILRRDAMIGHGLGHLIFGGVALGLFFHVWPIITALGAAIVAALGILKLREKAGVYEDTAIAIFSSIGMASGIVLVSMAKSFNVSLMSYLFGNILAISNFEVWVSVALTVIVLLIIVLFYQDLLFITFDSESARSSGLKVSRLEIILSLLTAVTAVLGMKVVGLLLVASLMVIPSAAGLQVARNFRQAIILAILVALFSVSLGLLTAFYWDLPASGAIILFASLFFVCALAIRAAKARFA